MDYLFEKGSGEIVKRSTFVLPYYLCDEIVLGVESILKLHQQKQQTTLPEKLEQLQQRINYTNDQINKFVYELYELMNTVYADQYFVDV